MKMLDFSENFWGNLHCALSTIYLDYFYRGFEILLLGLETLFHEKNRFLIETLTSTDGGRMFTRMFKEFSESRMTLTAVMTNAA